MKRTKEEQKAHEELMQSLKEFRESVERMTPEERKIHDQEMKELYEWLYPGSTYKGKTEET